MNLHNFRLFCCCFYFKQSLTFGLQSFPKRKLIFCVFDEMMKNNAKTESNLLYYYSEKTNLPIWVRANPKPSCTFSLTRSVRTSWPTQYTGTDRKIVNLPTKKKKKKWSRKWCVLILCFVFYSWMWWLIHFKHEPTKKPANDSTHSTHKPNLFTYVFFQLSVHFAHC